MYYEYSNDQTTAIDTHTHVISNAHPVAWKSHSKFQSGWLYESLLISKQLPVGVAMANPHPCLVNNAFPGT